VEIAAKQSLQLLEEGFDALMSVPEVQDFADSLTEAFLDAKAEAIEYLQDKAADVTAKLTDEQLQALDKVALKAKEAKDYVVEVAQKEETKEIAKKAIETSRPALAAALELSKKAAIATKNIVVAEFKEAGIQTPQSEEEWDELIAGLEANA